MKKDRVVISAHNSTMRTAFRLVALTAPFWAIYVPGLFLGIFGFFLDPIFFDANERIFWMLFSMGLGLTLTVLLLLNTLILSTRRAVFPPLKAASIPITEIKRVSWFFDPIERQAYMRFTLSSDDHIDMHYLRWTPEKIRRLTEALRHWAPSCEISVQPDDLDDLTEFRERFHGIRNLTLSRNAVDGTTDVIDIPYHPHEQLDKFFNSLGENEKYFWICWLTVLTVPCIAMIPDIIWGFVADCNNLERSLHAPPLLKLLDYMRDEAWRLAIDGVNFAGGAYLRVAEHPFWICVFIGMAVLSAVAFGMFIFQPNRIRLRREGIQISFNWRKLELSRTIYPWKDMVQFQLDQFGDYVNPEKWRLQIKMLDGTTVNLKIEAIKGTEAREKFLNTIAEMAPHAVIDPALMKALMPPQRESYTELWLQSLSAPPQRSRHSPLTPNQKLKGGRFIIERQLAVGGQGVAYIAADRNAVSSEKVVLKEFVLPVYTNKSIRKHSLERFENEARIMGVLDHPKIVKLRDYFLEDHRAYLVLEHIDGVNLRKHIQKAGRLSESEIISLALQMCEMLEYLHGQSPPVVHRDFTPDNLILDRSGKLVLIDFNVAQQRQWTVTGTVVGKHAYLPPEQFRGQPTTQSDLYAMGATLFYLVTGHDPEPLSTSNPARFDSSISADFDAIVAALTAVEAENRIANVEELSKRLLDLEFRSRKTRPGSLERHPAPSTTEAQPGPVETTDNTVISSLSSVNEDSVTVKVTRKPIQSPKEVRHGRT